MSKTKTPWDIRFMLGAAKLVKSSAKASVDLTDEAIFGALNTIPGHPKLKSYGQTLREHKQAKRWGRR